MKKLYIKIITGYRQDQEYTIDAEEAHKAYYLFLHPEKRGIFNNGVAIIGADIRHIAPDYNATMGWNPTYTINGQDWSDIKLEGVDRKLEHTLTEAKRIAVEMPDRINSPLTSVLLEQPK